MDRKQKILIGFSTVYAVLLILLSLSLLYYAFVFVPNKYSEYAIDIESVKYGEYAIEAPIDIAIEEIGNGEYRISNQIGNQIFKRVALYGENDFGLFGDYGLEELIEDINLLNDTFYMVENQIYVKSKHLDLTFLLFVIEPDYFYVNVTVFDSNINILSDKERTSILKMFLDLLIDKDTVDDKELNTFMNNLQQQSKYIALAMLSNVYYEKPVIYLYPIEKTDIQVNLDTIDFTTTYPQYDNGWFVTAYPDGTLIDKNGREYNYLYWEGFSNNFVDLSKGFVVEKNNYIEFLETTLSDIDMVDTEINDFISYWLPQMNEYEYCFMSFQMENYEKEVELKYSVEPNNELRVFVAFCGLNEPINVEVQDLSYYDDFVREGFVVVEWGGTFLENIDAVLYQTHNSIYKNGLYE